MVIKKRSKISVLLNEEEFQRFEAYCEQKGHKKSTLIALLIREHLDNNGFHTQRELFVSKKNKRDLR